jgi:hypothetical protein
MKASRLQGGDDRAGRVPPGRQHDGACLGWLCGVEVGVDEAAWGEETRGRWNLEGIRV